MGVEQPRSARRAPPAISRLLMLAGFCLCLGFAQAGAAQQPGEWIEHRMARGDTLIAIAQRLLADWRDWPEIQRINGIRDPRRIAPGSVIRIPVALARTIPSSARVVRVQGDARSRDAPLASGVSLPPGSEIATGSDGYVTVELADGSKLILQSSSRIRFRELARFPEIEGERSVLELERGRVELHAAPQAAPASRFEIRTPLATTAVRGTRFRVGSDIDPPLMRNEVLAGTVEVGGAGGAVRVAQGFGTVVDASRQPTAPVRLPPVPALPGLPPLQERVAFRIAFDPVAGATGYRAQVAEDPEFAAVVFERALTEPLIRIQGLPDRRYWLRVRAVDARGLEGADAEGAFVLKARPEPPLLTAPRDGAKASGDAIDLGWTAAAEAAGYRVQVARDRAFTDFVADHLLGSTTHRIEGLAPGEFHWRVAAIRADGDRGPFGDAQRFVQKSLPAMPEPPQLTDDRLALAWKGEAGQTFRLQVASDEAFAHLLVDLQLSDPRASLPKPPPGTYFIRVQAVDSDGYVGPFTASQRLVVPPPPPAPPAPPPEPAAPPPEPPNPWWALLLLLLLPLLLP